MNTILLDRIHSMILYLGYPEDSIALRLNGGGVRRYSQNRSLLELIEKEYSLDNPREEENLIYDPITGELTYYGYNESYHNRSSYDRYTNSIIPSDELLELVLQAVYNRYIEECKTRVKRELEERLLEEEFERKLGFDLEGSLARCRNQP